MNLGAFYVVVLVANGSRSEDISDFSGLGTRAPVAAISLAIFLFALTGIPPFSGFIGKVYPFAPVIHRVVSLHQVVGPVLLLSRAPVHRGRDGVGFRFPLPGPRAQKVRADQVQRLR